MYPEQGAAPRAAADLEHRIGAVVSRGGRPDLAQAGGPDVGAGLGRSGMTRAPLILFVGLAITTAVGIQASHQELTAPSPDDPGSPLNGLFDPNKNTKAAGYVFNELQFTDTTKAQVAARVEHVDLSGMTPAFIPDLFDLNADPSAIGPSTARSLSFTPKSGSLGLIQALPWGLSRCSTERIT